MPIITGHVDKKEGRDTLLGGPIQYTWTNPEAADTDHVVVAEAPATALGGTVDLTIAAQPDWVRPLVYTVSVDASADLTMRFDTYGTDFWGNARHEYVTNVTVAAAVNGNIAYRTVTRIVATTLGAAADAGDRVIVGYDGGRFGLPVLCKTAANVLVARLNFAQQVYVAGAPAGGQYTVATGPGYSNIEFGTVADATNDYEVECMSTYGIRYK